MANQKATSPMMNEIEGKQPASDRVAMSGAWVRKVNIDGKEVNVCALASCEADYDYDVQVRDYDGGCSYDNAGDGRLALASRFDDQNPNQSEIATSAASGKGKIFGTENDSLTVNGQPSYMGNKKVDVLAVLNDINLKGKTAKL